MVLNCGLKAKQIQSETNPQIGRCRAIFWNSWQSAWTFILSYDKMT